MSVKDVMMINEEIDDVKNMLTTNKTNCATFNTILNITNELAGTGIIGTSYTPLISVTGKGAIEEIILPNNAHNLFSGGRNYHPRVPVRIVVDGETVYEEYGVQNYTSTTYTLLGGIVQKANVLNPLYTYAASGLTAIYTSVMVNTFEFPFINTDTDAVMKRVITPSSVRFKDGFSIEAKVADIPSGVLTHHLQAFAIYALI